MPDMHLLFPEGKRKALTLSYDDGVEQDIRLIGIMDRYGLKGTFNINSDLYAQEGTIWPKGQVHRRMTKSQAINLYLNSDHEVAIHTARHADLSVLPASAAVWEVMKDKDALEKQFGCIVRGMAYPYGRYNDDVINILKICDIAYARTVNSHQHFEMPDCWLKWNPTCHHNDPNLMALARRFAEDKPGSRPELFYLWGHSYEFETDDNWHVIEEFASYIGCREDIWYATNIQIHDYVEAWRSMQISTDGLRIFNPSCKKLWIQLYNKVYTIDAGQEICLD